SRQGQDAMVHDPETCLPGGGWTLLESGAVEISPGVFAQRYLAQRDRTRVLFYTWYVSAGSVQGTTWAHRLEFGRSFFTGRSEGAMVRVLVSVDESAVAEREDSLLQFSRLWMKAVEEVLPK
ncbi:MAG: exosortase C-terminal domain/associated protein EpsI, partial [Myxococcota bacterium]